MLAQHKFVSENYNRLLDILKFDEPKPDTPNVRCGPCSIHRNGKCRMSTYSVEYPNGQTVPKLTCGSSSSEERVDIYEYCSVVLGLQGDNIVKQVVDLIDR